MKLYLPPPPNSLSAMKWPLTLERRSALKLRLPSLVVWCRNLFHCPAGKPPESEQTSLHGQPEPQLHHLPTILNNKQGTLIRHQRSTSNSITTCLVSPIINKPHNATQFQSHCYKSPHIIWMSLKSGLTLYNVRETSVVQRKRRPWSPPSSFQSPNQNLLFKRYR